jgi:hypothetical protein
VRHTPEDIEGVRACLHGYPSDMKVEVKPGVPVVAKTVADLRSLSTWPPGLVLNFPQPGDRYPASVAVVEPHRLGLNKVEQARSRPTEWVATV